MHVAAWMWMLLHGAPRPCPPRSGMGSAPQLIRWWRITVFVALAMRHVLRGDIEPHTWVRVTVTAAVAVRQHVETGRAS